MPLFPFLRKGRPVLDLAFVTSLYFRNYGDERLREGVLTALDLYVQAVGFERFTWWSGDPKNRHWRKPNDKTLPRIREYVRGAEDRGMWDLLLMGGKQAEDVSPFQCDFYSGPNYDPPERRMGHLHFCLPISWYRDDPTRQPLDLFHAMVEAVRPAYGYHAIGFATSPLFASPYRRSVEWFEYQAAWKVAPLMIEIPLCEADYYAKGIKGGSWLTALHDEWLDKLGGAAAVKAALGEEFTFRPYDGGLVIQAGPEPMNGYWSIRDPLPKMFDECEAIELYGMPPQVLDSEVMAFPPEHFPLYQKLNRLLKPIRLPTMRRGISSRRWIETGFFDEAETARWLARFD